MELRRAYDYATPTTLVAIIGDAIDSVSPTAGPLSVTYTDAHEIIDAAMAALEANAGVEKAIDMLVAAGITIDDMEFFGL